ncbi:NADPH oxidase activator 1 isoform X2 [Synchiropus splendidus]|uniref:NADPH oxidase activator 1 isoform X2 n=1 Tax=Synchiropus splendidus TaxID=270530 RepID=UPI00237DE91C|nr:NADPH oxidase activator 1 isoform X2 [Synchiropus splendidus]
MLYTELLRLWDEAVQAVDARDWQTALKKFQQISEPTSRTLFGMASVHLCLEQPVQALKALDLTIAKDERLAVGFFQRAAVMMKVGRLEEALSDCVWAQKHMRGNTLIDYNQLGLRFKLYSWQVLHNTAAVYCFMGQWDQAREMLLSQAQDIRRVGNLEATLESVLRKERLTPLQVPQGTVFRPRKQDVEQLKEKDYLGKSKVISSIIPNDDFAGFEPNRMQKPGYYQPKTDGGNGSRYMRMGVPYMARGPGQLTVPGGAVVFLFGEEDSDGMVTVIHDGQRGQVPFSLLKPEDVHTRKGKKDNRVPSGIPLPPGLQPPTRPKSHPPTAAPPQNTSPPAYADATYTQLPGFTANAASNQDASPGSSSLLVKVHYTYTVALSVPADTSCRELKEQIAQKLGQPASNLRLRWRQQGYRALKPLEVEGQPCRSLLEVSEAGRATLWCQKEDPTVNCPILYQMVAQYNYVAQGPEDLDFAEGDTIDVLGEVNDEWLEGHCAGRIGIFPSCFAYKDEGTQVSQL